MSHLLKYLHSLEGNTIILKNYFTCYAKGKEIARELAEFFNLENYSFKIKNK